PDRGPRRLADPDYSDLSDHAHGFSAEIRRGQCLRRPAPGTRDRAACALLPPHQTGRPLRDHHRQGFPAAPSETWGVAQAPWTLASDHSAFARSAGVDSALGLAAAGLQAAAVLRLLGSLARQLPGGLGTRR